MDPVSRDDLAGFCVFQTQIRSKKFEKTGPDPESLVIFGSSRSLRGLYICHFLSKNMAEFQLH